MLVAYHLADQSLPRYSNKFSRKDFTLPQLFACLVVKEQMKRSYRGAEALLADCQHWCKAIGMRRVPDHNTLWRAASFLLRNCRVDKLLDRVAHWAALARILQLSSKPLAADSTYFESRHVSRHYERRCRQTRRKSAKSNRRNGGASGAVTKRQNGGNGRRDSLGRNIGTSATRSRTTRRLPKLAISVSAASHLVLSLWTATGMGGDHPSFQPVLVDAWRRVPNRRFKAVFDAGFDSEEAHELARRDLGVRSIIPAEIGRPSKTGALPSTRWRRLMKRMLATAESRKRCGYTQRWQAETVNSMIKRNQGSALAGQTAHSRKRDMALKVLTHNVMILKPRVETEQVANLLTRRVGRRGLTGRRVHGPTLLPSALPTSSLRLRTK